MGGWFIKALASIVMMGLWSGQGDARRPNPR